MKLFLHDQVFENGGTARIAFFHAVYESRHAVALDEGGKQFCRWLQDRSRDDREYVNEAIRISYSASSKVVLDVAHVSTSDWDNDIVSVQDAMSLIRLPYRILLENKGSDRRMLMAVANAEQRDFLKRAEQEKRLVFEQAGGIEEVEKFLLHDINHDRGRLKTTFVVIDSDAHWIRRPSDTARRVLRVCRDHRVPCHMLWRRSSENYLTLESLEEYKKQNHPHQAKREQLYSSFVRMTHLHRRHYHMKDGFKKSHGPEFESIKQSEAELALGWGPKIGEIFEQPCFRHCDLVRERAMRELGPFMRKLIAYIG